MIAALYLSCLTVKAVLPYSEPLSLERMADAIRQVENSKLEHIGAAGERGLYQITPAVWRQHSSAPHHWASSSREVCQAETLRVVLAHLTHLRVQLACQRPPFPDTPYFVALAFCAGPTATTERTASDVKRDYAARAQACYFDRKP